MRKTKTIATLGLVAALTVANIMPSYVPTFAAEQTAQEATVKTNQTISNEERQEIEKLIDEGNNVKGGWNTEEQHAWMNKVKSFNERYNDNMLYDDIKSICEEEYIDITNIYHELARLMALRDGFETDIDKLITRGKQFKVCDNVSLDTDDGTPEAFLWALNVHHYNESHPENGEYDHLKQISYSASRDLFLGEGRDEIVSILNIIKGQKVTARKLDKIYVDENDVKHDYLENECFDKTGLRVYGTYTYYYNKGTPRELNREITKYEVDTDTPLQVGTNDMKISVTYDGEEYTTSVRVYVKEASSNDENEYDDELIDLIREGKSISNLNSNAAYNWVLKVKKYNEAHNENSLYEDIKKKCEDMINTSINDTDKNMVIAYLNVIKDEKITDIQLDKIYVEGNYKTVYNEGETFDKTNLDVYGIYKYTYNNGNTRNIKKKIDNYTVTPDKALKRNDKNVTVKVTDGNVTRSVDVSIYVNYKEDNATTEPSKETTTESSKGQTTTKPGEKQTTTSIKTTPKKKKCKLPKLTKVKKKRLIYGKGPKGAKVHIKIGKKTYVKRINKKGKFVIKVKNKITKKTKMIIWTTKKNYKSSDKIAWYLK